MSIDTRTRLQKNIRDLELEEVFDSVLPDEGLVKPLGIVRGLSDLPWHKDCGQGQHSYKCSGLTCGISVTGADRVSGALGVIPGSRHTQQPLVGLGGSRSIRCLWSSRRLPVAIRLV